MMTDPSCWGRLGHEAGNHQFLAPGVQVPRPWTRTRPLRSGTKPKEGGSKAPKKFVYFPKENKGNQNEKTATTWWVGGGVAHPQPKQLRLIFWKTGQARPDMRHWMMKPVEK